MNLADAYKYRFRTTEDRFMAISYKKLWHILLDKDLHKKDLIQMAGISEYTVKKLSRNENVSTEVLGKLSKALECSIDDLVDYSEEQEDR